MGTTTKSAPPPHPRPRGWSGDREHGRSVESAAHHYLSQNPPPTPRRASARIDQRPQPPSSSTDTRPNEPRDWPSSSFLWPQKGPPSPSYPLGPGGGRRGCLDPRKRPRDKSESQPKNDQISRNYGAKPTQDGRQGTLTRVGGMCWHNEVGWSLRLAIAPSSRMLLTQASTSAEAISLANSSMGLLGLAWSHILWTWAQSVWILRAKKVHKTISPVRPSFTSTAICSKAGSNRCFSSATFPQHQLSHGIGCHWWTLVGMA
jgi:hypothetical protein